MIPGDPLALVVGSQNQPKGQSLDAQLDIHDSRESITPPCGLLPRAYACSISEQGSGVLYSSPYRLACLKVTRVEEVSGDRQGRDLGHQLSHGLD